MSRKLSILIVLALLVFMGIFALGSTEVVKVTTHTPYMLLRATADGDVNAINLTTAGDYARKPAGAVRLPAGDIGSSHPARTLLLMFCGTDTANETFAYRVLMWAKDNGPAEVPCSGTGILGTQAVIKYPHNDIAEPNALWADTLTTTGIATVLDSGNNRIAKLAIPLCGMEWVYTEITDANGTGSEAGDITVYYRYYN